jgi:hypothetical protein
MGTVLWGCDFKHKIKPRTSKQRAIEELAVKTFYEAIGKEPPPSDAPPPPDSA